jgi:glycosyltransferase involved in cell wall biosynthesis
MKILLCCEFYFPSLGGVQVVMQQIAERLVKQGHQVLVATTKLKDRNFSELNGVAIHEFEISGNLVNGYRGNIKEYKKFIESFDGDVIMIKAAQQWTFDCIWDELEIIKVKKVFIPCGFSGLYEDRYRAYFKALPRILRLFDCLIFYSNDYRDINFAKEHGLDNIFVLSNGADEREFLSPADPNFRKNLGIGEDEFLILHVGSTGGAKGQMELLDALDLVHPNENKIRLILNANNPFPEVKEDSIGFEIHKIPFLPQSLVNRIYKLRILFVEKQVRGDFLGLLKNTGSLKEKLRDINKKLNEQLFIHAPPQKSEEGFHSKLLNKVREFNLRNSNKEVMVVDFAREQLVQAYHSANLFVFPSYVEYSPLVLFEAAASGTPFLSSDAGNARELVDWLGGGYVIDTPKDKDGYCIISPQIFASELNILLGQKYHLAKMGKKMQSRWRDKYTWQKVAEEYEAILINN